MHANTIAVFFISKPLMQADMNITQYDPFAEDPSMAHMDIIKKDMHALKPPRSINKCIIDILKNDRFTLPFVMDPHASRLWSTCMTERAMGVNSTKVNKTIREFWYYVCNRGPRPDTSFVGNI